jgi:phosphatidylinositol alpha-1,6-mannosyltransferase
VITQEFYSVLSGYFAKMLYRIPYIHIQEMTSRAIPTVANRIKISLQRVLLPRLNYDKFVSWTRSMKESHYDKWGFKSEIVILPTGVDTDKFNPSVDGREIRKKYSIPDDYILMITGKPLYELNSKGVEYIIKALPKIIKENKKLRYIIVGDGNGKKTLEKMVGEYGLREYVIFAGAQPHDEMPKYFAAADMFVLSFVHECSISVALAESMATGNPSVVTRIGEMKNQIDDKTGIFVRPKDPDSIAAGVIKMMKDPKLRKTMGMNASKKINEKYNVNYIAKRTVELLEGARK